ncbi:hypothetical protein [Brevundimonas diminuta]|uniref:hypothetical protein n=1 Tax=Brevundimonas diminuta TaxID=293 RepID=UPI000FE19772|nr:hypothetical protein [Brevundimonas diminuta]
MTERYKDRTIGQVEIYGLAPAVLDGVAGGPPTEGVSASVMFRLASPDGGFGGPEATLALAFDHSPDASVRDAQQQALAAAHALLKRLAAEPLEDLQAKLSDGLREALLPTKD